MQGGYWDWLTPLVPGMNWLLSFSRICLVTMGSLNSTKQYRAIVLQRGSGQETSIQLC